MQFNSLPHHGLGSRWPSTQMAFSAVLIQRPIPVSVLDVNANKGTFAGLDEGCNTADHFNNRHVITNRDAAKGGLMGRQNWSFTPWFTITAILICDKIKATGWRKTPSKQPVPYLQVPTSTQASNRGFLTQQHCCCSSQYFYSCRLYK